MDSLELKLLQDEEEPSKGSVAILNKSGDILLGEFNTTGMTIKMAKAHMLHVLNALVSRWNSIHKPKALLCENAKGKFTVITADYLGDEEAPNA